MTNDQAKFVIRTFPIWKIFTTREEIMNYFWKIFKFPQDIPPCSFLEKESKIFKFLNLSIHFFLRQRYRKALIEEISIQWFPPRWNPFVENVYIRASRLRGATLKRIFQCDVVESDSCGSDIHKGSINLKKKKDETKEKRKQKKKEKSSAPTFYKMET